MPGYLCIHGHFYQPPRENPWLDAVPRQLSAAPFHDWNERITDECYRPCTAARVVRSDGHITEILDVYRRISFDVGPTLLSWLDRHAPDVHAQIIEADRVAVERWGHGCAMAQGYNHTILPLSTPRDRLTQVRWGLADFKHRFGRDADGLWLPECAVDTPTLEVLAAEGLAFTVLAPEQVEAVFQPDGTPSSGGLDPRRPYRVDLPSGRSIAVFVYDGPVSRSVAFDHLLESGDRFFERLRSIIGPDQLGHIATDGESYGHHHRYGEMALAWALRRIEDAPDVEILPYAAYLATHPPTWTVQIREGSSWSCPHGVERWRSDCGCSTGGNDGWNQAWRAPLRQAIDGLGERLDTLFEAEAAALLADPWAARDHYIDVLLQPAHVDAWLDRHAARPLGHDARVRARELLEMQRHRMYMTTSCGWFFDDLAGLEPVQDLAYAWRALDLAGRIRPDRDDPFLAELAEARSNDPSSGNGADLIRKRVAPQRFDGVRATAHHAAATTISDRTRWNCFTFEDAETCRQHVGSGILVTRRSVVTEQTTGRQTAVMYAAFAGPGRLLAGARAGVGSAKELAARLAAGPHVFEAEFTEVLDGIDDLLDTDQHAIIGHVEAYLAKALTGLGDLWETWSSMLPTLTGESGSVPVRAAAWAAHQSALADALASTDPLDLRLVSRFMAVSENPPRLGALRDPAQRGVARLTEALDPEHPSTLGALTVRLATIDRLGIEIDIWHAQNAVLDLLEVPSTFTVRWQDARLRANAVLGLAVDT